MEQGNGKIAVLGELLSTTSEDWEPDL